MSMIGPLWPMLLAVIVLLLVGGAGVVASRSSDPARHVRGRVRLALGAFGAALLLSWAWGAAQPQLLGLPVVVGPGAAAAIGVLVFTLPPSHAAGAVGGRRIATLRTRSAKQVLGARTLLLPSALLVLLVGVLLVTGLSAAPTGEAAGRSFAVELPASGASGGPYPGWFYGAPVLATVLLLVVAVAIAVRRTVLLPAITPDDAADTVWRAAVVRSLVSIATAGLLLYLAGVLWAAGVAWRVLGQTGSAGLEPVAAAQGSLSVLAALCAVVLLVVSTVRVAAVGRAVGDGRAIA